MMRVSPLRMPAKLSRFLPPKALQGFGALAIALGTSCALLTAPLQARPADKQQAAATDATAPMPYSQGVLWKVEREGQEPSHVFGTIHLNYEEILDLPKPVKQAFDAARSASFEIKMDRESMLRMGQASVFRNWRTLDDVLGPDLYADVVHVAESYGLTVHHLRRLQPWALVMFLYQFPGVSAYEETDEPFLDKWLHDEALEQDKKVYPLESIEEHVGVFNDLPEKTLRKLVRSLLEAHGEFQIEAEMRHQEMVQLYLARDIGGIMALTGEADQDPRYAEVNAVVMERLLDRRNHNMVQRMEMRLKEGKAFIAVGAGHLPGKEGVLNLLAERGYRLTRVY